MAEQPQDVSPRVAISTDKTRAELIIPGEMDRTLLSPEFCQAILQEAGIEINASVRAKVSALVEAFEPGTPSQGSVAEAAPAVHGEPGWIEWFVTEPEEKSGSDADSERVDFYSQSAFIMVEAGQSVGKIHPPTVGEDGRDVYGRSIPAKDGRPANLKLDETIIQEAGGNLLAQTDGVLVREDDRAYVKNVLVVPEYVDFSTGNIDFNGDVIVEKGVRDRFVVEAEGLVQVKGLIEAATIEAGQGLEAPGGFAGRERGTMRVRGDVRARYLDNICGTIGGNLYVEKEVINCDLEIRGSIDCDHSAIIGGTTIVTGEVRIGTVGSGGNVLTEVVLGSVPHLQPLRFRLDSLVEALCAQRDLLTAEQTQINQGTRRLTSQDKERQTEIMFYLMSLESRVTEGHTVQNTLEEKIKSMRTIRMLITRQLYSGSRITVDHQSFDVKKDVKGPITIEQHQREITYRRGNQHPVPLTDIAEVRAVRQAA